MNRTAGLFWIAALAACGPSGGEGDPAEPGDIVELVVAPGDAELVVRDGAPASQAYTAVAHLADGSERDVTGETRFEIEDGRLGGFDGALFTASGAAGGASAVRAVYAGSEARATLVVRIEHSRVDPSAPADAPGLFGDAGEDPARAPALVYPSFGTVVPPNLGDFEAHWTDGAGNDLFELRLAGAYVDLRVYLVGTVEAAGRWAALTPEEWQLAGESARGDALTVTVRGLSTAAPATAGTSPAVRVELTSEDVDGGIYYWASTGARPSGIYRHDMARPGEPAEAFYTTQESPGNRCVACHVLSRDGTRMAITLDGGDGAGTILDVATRTPMLPDNGSYRWNFAAFEPDGARLVTVHQGQMTLRDAATGEVVATVPTGGYATHPDFSPRGDAIVYVSVASPAADWHFSGGSLVVQPFDAATASFGAPTTLVPASGDNLYYPSWSPDGRFILYNRSTEDAYDDASAELYVVPADGSAPPRRLDSPNLAAGVTNSWARWAPFAQRLAPGAADEEAFFWLTFSSKRAFGVRLPGGQPQLWMAPFFPARLAAGADPSAPAFRLPFQDIATNNHIAQWTERVVEVE